MDSKKLEQLVELIINENEEAAVALFHDIVVETSREIYESIMEDEMDELGGPVGQMLDEIGAEESGMTEDELEDPMDSDEGEFDDEVSDFGDEEGMDDGEVMDIEHDEEGEEGRMDDLEDRVVSAEEKLEKLMAEFEDILGQEDGDEEAADDEEAAADDEEEAADDEEEAADDEEEAADDEEEAAMMEAKLVAVKKPAGGDNGANSRSPVAAKSRIPSPAKAVNFDTGSAAGRAAPSVKPGKTYGNTGLGHKPRQTPAPKAHTKDTTHSKSPLGESKVARKKIK